MISHLEAGYSSQTPNTQPLPFNHIKALSACMKDIHLLRRGLPVKLGVALQSHHRIGKGTDDRKLNKDALFTFRMRLNCFKQKPLPGIVFPDCLPLHTSAPDRLK
jgi:hypothetical protein